MFSHRNAVSSSSSLSSSEGGVQNVPNVKGSPLPPPLLLISDHRHQGVKVNPSSALPGTVTPTISEPAILRTSRSVPKTIEPRKDQENTGRWSEEEHRVFLNGLEEHGKQWKLIASMIGTRTVVQVRTHAQKYFQKMERSNQKGKVQTVSHVMAKRKSLPSSMPSRKKMKTRRTQITRSASISLATMTHPTSPVPELPSIVSNVSVNSVDSGVSPVGVADLDLAATGIPEWSGESLYLETTPDVALPPNLEDLPEDPLEWLLVGGGIQHLPESSLVSPAFPEFDLMDCSDPVHQEKDSLVDHCTATTIAQPIGLTESISTSTATLNMADPKVSVQSLL